KSVRFLIDFLAILYHFYTLQIAYEGRISLPWRYPQWQRPLPRSPAATSALARGGARFPTAAAPGCISSSSPPATSRGRCASATAARRENLHSAPSSTTGDRSPAANL